LEVNTMTWHLLLGRKALIITPLLLSLSLMLMVACGEAAPAAPSAPEPQAGGESAPAASAQTGEAAPTPTLFIEVIKREPTPTAMAGAAPTAVPTAMPAVEGEYGGHVPMQTYSAPVTSRPLPEGTYSHMIALAPLYNQIVEYNPETDDPSDIRCDLCTSWDISEDGLTYTYHLPEHGRWSDGEPITSDDIIFTLERLCCMNIGST
jgi:ABC-type transport system substrate-binding protein